MKFDPALSIWLNRTETKLVEKIDQGSMPFLGGYLDFLDHNSRQYFEKKLSGSRNSLRSFQIGLDRWPAVFSTYLTIAVVEGYGKDSSAAVWPYINKAMASQPSSRSITTNTDKEILWKSYRKACIKIGLSVFSRKSGNQYMVNEFLHQAGVPLKYIPNLANKMIGYAKSNGLPEEDDTYAIKQWRLGLLDSMGAVQKPVDRALRSDDTDYFPQLFLQCMKGSNNNSGSLENIFFEAIKESERTTELGSKLFKIPEVVWSDESICIKIPSGDGEEWEILTDGVASKYLSLPDNQVITLFSDLPMKAEVRNLKNNKIWDFKLWGAAANNRFMLFNEQGGFVKSCSLADEVHHLDPGKYQVVSRFIPRDYEVQEILTSNPTKPIYYFAIELLPAKKVTFSKGPVSITLVGDSKPVLVWHGSQMRGVRGSELFASENLSVQLQIPEELQKGNDAVLMLKLGSSNSPDEDTEISFQLGSRNTIDIPLEEALGQWDAGLINLTASVFYKGGSRNLVRKSAYVWNGLKEIKSKYFFEFSSKPKNLNQDESNNLDLGSNHLTFKENHNRFFHAVFDINNSRKRTFNWTVPGTFLYMEKNSDNGLVEKPIIKGSLVSVKEGLGESLKLFSDVSGILRFGRFSQYYDFSNSRYKKIPLNSLIEYIEPDQNFLSFQSEGCKEPEQLIRLSSPQNIIDFRTNLQSNDTYQVIFKLINFADEIEVVAVNLLDGHQTKNQLVANNPTDILSSRKKFSFLNKSEGNGEATHILDLPLKNWESGAWIFSFKIKVGRRWHELSNDRKDKFFAGLILSSGRAVSPENIFNSINFYPQTELISRFKHTHLLLMNCFSESSWSEVGWLKQLWFSLGRELNLKNKQTLIELLRLSIKKPDEDSEPSWVPVCSINAHFLDVYALPSDQYSLLAHESLLPLRTLYLMSRFSSQLTIFFSEGIVYRTVAAGFSNFINMTKGDEPESFDMASYKQALSRQDLRSRIRLLNQEDWRPSEGQYLGPLHYNYALGRLKSNYLLTLGSGVADNHMGNHWRRGQALRLLNALRNHQVNDFAKGVPAHWVSKTTNQHLGLLNTEDDNDDQQEVENLMLIVEGVSLLAHVCRWDSRSPGALVQFKAFSQQLIDVNEEQLELILGYLLFIGEDIFSFYLLLWEFLIKADENQSLAQPNLD